MGYYNIDLNTINSASVLELSAELTDNPVIIKILQFNLNSANVNVEIEIEFLDDELYHECSDGDYDTYLQLFERIPGKPRSSTSRNLATSGSARARYDGSGRSVGGVFIPRRDDPQRYDANSKKRYARTNRTIFSQPAPIVSKKQTISFSIPRSAIGENINYGIVHSNNIDTWAYFYRRFRFYLKIDRGYGNDDQTAPKGPWPDATTHNLLLEYNFVYEDLSDDSEEEGE